ncbi:GTP-binding protein OBGC [Abeliophyllum distichum]|uniref:GTP-binding protein OBGC n=1 Tax=Abeliophyllum distichum TaxID=126358 RepID=A0ABD1VW88_9LAMI
MVFTCIHTAVAAYLNITTRFSATRRNPKTPQIQKLKSQKYPTTPQTPPLCPGSEATTFTHLPPKDDFFIDSPPQSLAETIKLSESEPANTRIRKFNKMEGENFGVGLRNGENLGLGYERFELFEVEDGSNTGNGCVRSNFDYGKFEFYEVNSDSEFENDDEFDDVEEEKILGW